MATFSADPVDEDPLRTAAAYRFQADWYMVLHLSGSGRPVPADLAFRLVDALPVRLVPELARVVAYRGVPPGPAT